MLTTKEEGSSLDTLFGRWLHGPSSPLFLVASNQVGRPKWDLSSIRAFYANCRLAGDGERVLKRHYLVSRGLGYAYRAIYPNSNPF